MVVASLILLFSTAMFLFYLFHLLATVQRILRLKH
jgi:hypothetical protein